VREASDRDLERFLATIPTTEFARGVSRLAPEDQDALFRKLRPADAADLVEQLPASQVNEIVERLTADEAALIVQELPSDERADLIGGLDEEEAADILAALPPGEAEVLRTLSEYPEESAGGLMVTEFLAYAEDRTVASVVRDLRQRASEYADYDIQYAYVTNRVGRLVGVLRLRDLLLSLDHELVGSMMIRDPLTVLDTTGLDGLRDFFDSHNFLGVPVVDARGRMLGVVHRAFVEEARTERSEQDYLKAQGIIGGDELRGMPLLLRSRRRLAWLSVNILLNIMAASVIAMQQDTLEAAIALAVFLPIISDMSGCSGNQAVAVSIRELTLGLIEPRDIVRVWLKEIGVGAINGVVLGALIGLAAWLWKANVYLGLVVGGALAINTVVAVSIGGTIPLLLRRFGFDSALASGPVLTTVTDMCGFFLTLSFAAAALSHLAGM
jgi:magnesium transporter